jgi:hypothetical protein
MSTTGTYKKFKDVKPYHVFFFASEIDGVKGLRSASPSGPWMRTGSRTYQHVEDMRFGWDWGDKPHKSDHRVGSINTGVYEHEIVED